MQLKAAALLPVTGLRCQSLRDAGYSQTTATRASAVVWRRIENNPECRRLLFRAGVTESRLAGKISDLIDAKHTKDGEEQDDHPIQLRATELCLKMFGLMDDGDHLEQVMSTYIGILVRVVDEQLPKEARSPFLRAIATAMSEAVAASKALPVEPAGDVAEREEQASGGDLEAVAGGA